MKLTRFTSIPETASIVATKGDPWISSSSQVTWIAYSPGRSTSYDTNADVSPLSTHFMVAELGPSIEKPAIDTIGETLA